MFYKTILLIAGLCLILYAACSKVPSQTTTEPSSIAPSTSIGNTTYIKVPASGFKQVGDLRVWIINSPDPPRAGSGTLDTYVIDSNGQPVSDAVLTYDINMTNMNMGRSILRPSLVSEGRYSRAVKYSMEGPWRVTITIVHAGQTSTTWFDFTVNS